MVLNKKRLAKHYSHNILWHFWSTNALAICPWQRMSRKVCCDWPVAWAKVSPSAMVAMKLPWTMLRMSIILAALPTSPAHSRHTQTDRQWGGQGEMGEGGH